MPEREWQNELEQFLQTTFDGLWQRSNQPGPRPVLRIFPAPAPDEARCFMLGLDAGMFALDEAGIVHSRLIGPGIDLSGTEETFPLFITESSPPRLIRERLCQLATAGTLVFDRGWLERQVELLPSGVNDAADILLHSLGGKFLAAVAIKRTAPEVTKFSIDLQQCCRRGQHPIENCGFPQNHRHFEFCAAHKPPYFWAVAPGADACFKLNYPVEGGIEVEQLPTLPRRSRIELELESYWTDE